MAVVTESQGLPLLSDYTRFMRRHWARIGALVTLGLLGGLAWSLQQPSTFSATASLALAPVPVYVMPTANELVPPEVSIDTDAQLLHSPRVLGAIGDALGTDADAAIDHLSVTASPHTHVLHLTVAASSPRLAADAADAAAAAFVDVRRGALGSLRNDQLRQLRLLLSNQERLLAQEQTRRLVLPTQDDLFAQILELRASLDELEEARSEPAVLVRPAVPPSNADYANTEVPLTSGAMLGLLGGCLLGLARDRLLARPPAGPPTLTNMSGYLPDAATHLEEHHHAV